MAQETPELAMTFPEVRRHFVWNGYTIRQYRMAARITMCMVEEWMATAVMSRTIILTPIPARKKHWDMGIRINCIHRLQKSATVRQAMETDTGRRSRLLRTILKKVTVFPITPKTQITTAMIKMRLSSSTQCRRLPSWTLVVLISTLVLISTTLWFVMVLPYRARASEYESTNTSPGAFWGSFHRISNFAYIRSFRKS